MKKIFQMMALLLTAAVATVGCKPEPLPEPEPEQPKTTVEIDESIDVAPEGGNYLLEYFVDNLSGTLSATSEATWISDIKLNVQTLTFVVANNLGKGATSREANIDIKCGEEVLASVAIKQAAEGELTLQMEVANITPESIDVTVTPSNDNMTYFIGIAPKAFIEEMGGVDAYVLIDAEAYRTSFYGDILDDYLAKGTTTKTITIQGAPEEPMWVYVAGLSRAADKTRTPIVTTKAQHYEFQFLPYPELSLQSYSVDFTADESGTHSIPYSIDYPIEGQELTFNLGDGGDNWIHNIRVEGRKILFDFDANPYPVERSTQLEVAYKYSPSCLFDIRQAAGVEMTNVEFEITAVELHYDRVVVNCTPSNSDVKYVVGAVAKMDFEGAPYDGDSTKIPEFDLASNYPTYVITQGKTEGITLNHTAISYDPQWYIYAYAIDDAEQRAISTVTMELVTLVEDRPYFVWDDSRISSNAISVDNTEQTITVKYKVENAHATGVVTVDDPYDDVLIKGADGKRITHDPVAQTITFTVSANTTKKSRTTYAYLTYYSSEDDKSSDANISLKINQKR